MKRATLASLLAAILAFGGTALAKDPVSVKITQGPRVEYTTANTAIIAWSTDRPSSSVVRYGLNGGLDKTAQSPYTSGTHRVTLRNLQPGANYSFQVESGQARGNGSDVKSGVMTFATRAAGTPANNPTTGNNRRHDGDHDADDQRRDDGDHDADDAKGGAKHADRPNQPHDAGKHKGWDKDKKKDKDKDDKNKKDKDKDGDHDHR